MSTSTTREPQAHRPPLAPGVGSHIVVVTKGSNTVSPEIRVARALADRFGSKVDVLSIVEAIPPATMISDVGLVAPIVPLVVSDADLQQRQNRLGDELTRAGRPDWNITVMTGWPGEQIAEGAKRLGATLIIMGIGRHAPVDRLLGSETALQVIQSTDIPVLAITHDLIGVPQRAVAAVDFTEQSEAAAHVAAELVADAGTLYLAHVRTDWTEQMDPQIPVDLYAEGVERRFDQLERQLAKGHVAPRTVERVFRSGDPAPEILTLANVNAVDLIAVGARTHSRLYRMFLGSVAAKLLRSAHCSVLVIPARAEQARRPRSVRAVARAATLPKQSRRY